MLSWFIDWTTALHHENRLAYAVVTVLTMATIGVAVAISVEWLLKRLSSGRSDRAGEHSAHGH